MRGIHVLVVAAVAACGSTSPPSGNGEDTAGIASMGGGSSGGSGTAAGSGSSGDAADASGGTTAGMDIVEIDISPEAPAFEVIDGAIPDSIQLEATAVTSDGQKIPLDGVWSVQRLDVVNVDASSGELTASGLAGGIVEVDFSSPEGDASIMATVKMHLHDDGGVDDSVKQVFGGATMPDPSLDLLYPYDATVFPRDLTAPVVQWSGGAPTDTYYFHLTSPTFEYEAYMTGVDPGRYTFPVDPIDAWKKLTASVVADDVQVALQRYDGTTAYQPVTSSWHVADATLVGTIYYWEINNGNVVRLEVGDPAPETFLQKPAGVTCVACHSVSADGTTLVAAYGDMSNLPWGTFETSDGASLYSSGAASGFEAISPEGDYVVAGQTNGVAQLSTFDANDVLATLTVANGFPVYPAWSPDGTKLAYGIRTDGNWVDFVNSTLWVTDVDLVTPGFSNDYQLVSPVDGRPTVTYPTWSPDSKWLAFGRVSQSRSRGGQGEVWVTNLDGSIQQSLDEANGLAYLAADQSAANYEPTFMPESRGGYLWLVFVSERTYGNTLTDTDPTTRHKQLWVTAIDDAPKAGQDPSHPAFWLPGQEIDNQNMRGAWTLAPPDAQG